MLTQARDQAFRARLEPHRRAITAHCYRMLGSLQDAEEVAQDSLVRGWQRLEELRSSESARAWLYRIATNACLDMLKKKRRRRGLPNDLKPAADPEQPVGLPAEEELWIEPAPDSLLDVADDPLARPDALAFRRESIGLAFIAALQRLPPKQRAALLLVDVLGWRPRETAELLQTTQASVNSLLQRARTNLGTSSGSPSLGERPEDQAMVRRFVASWENGDLDAFTTMLAKDAILAMPPQPEWFEGAAAIRRFFERLFEDDPKRFRLLPIRANGSAGVAVYAAPMHGGSFEAVAITVFTLRDGVVSRITKFTMPKLFRRFGLAERLG